MKTNPQLNVTVTLNSEDMMELFETGELSGDGVVIGTTEPELERFKSMLDQSVSND